MSCRKHSPGNPCCVPPDCVSQCNAYIPATTWGVSVLGQSLTLNQHPTYKCYYQAELCWLDSVTEEASWDLSYGWEDGGWDFTPANPCPSDCFGVTYDVLNIQTHYRASVKRFSQTRYYLFVSIGPTSPTSTLLQATVIYSFDKRYFHGASHTARTRYRISTGTCPAAPTAGSWISSSAPTMLSVEKPSFFDDCVGLLNNDFGTCPYELGSVVSPTTWGSFSVGTIRTYASGCSVSSGEAFVPDDIAVRKSTGIAPTTDSWTPCDAVLDPTVFACDASVARTRTYQSATFECSAIPASISCVSGLSTIPSSSVMASCGPQTYTNTTPALSANVTLTL
jgi:hypothetical protein